MLIKFNKEKYLQIAKSESPQAALTQLHRDTERWEYQTFEGNAGYQPQMWEELREVRKFSRELWEMALQA
jgi:hypothetical protein